MAQWKYMFLGKSHLSKVRDRTELLEQAILQWNSMEPSERRPSLRKKILRLADGLLSAVCKEKKAYLDRTTLDEQSERFKSGLAEIQRLLDEGPNAILSSKGTLDWNSGTIDEPNDAAKPSVDRSDLR